MSLAGEAPPPPAALAAPADATCAQCHAPLADGQEWCLECGAARTLIHRPPDWRIPVAVVATVVVLVLAAFAVALINLSSSADRSSQAGQSAGAAPLTTAAPTPGG
jgi:hypothetical protein